MEHVPAARLLGARTQRPGFVPTVNDMSIRNDMSWQALKPGAFYRRMFVNLATETHWTTGGLPSGIA